MLPMKSAKFTISYSANSFLTLLGVFLSAVILGSPVFILGGDETDPSKEDIQFSQGPVARETIDPELSEILSISEPDRELEVIVQFRPTMTDEDMKMARKSGFEILSTYDSIHGFYGRGTPEAIMALEGYERTFWMENNSQMEYLMHDTTSVVEAVRTWNSNIVDGNGFLIQDAFGTYHRIDGTGVGVAVIDTGVDAGHPDFDYDEGKTMAYKYTGGGWVETENSDTSSGHGTHCGGTIAGNGDASAGSRKGTAPGATLIGLGVGDLVFVNFGLDGFEWVYEHSRPDDNPYNIRVTSNSWGTAGAEYNPNDAIAQIILALARDNNVVTFFAAGNAGGDGSTIETGPHANIPLAISVAAMEHDGSGIASFSSRGHSDKPQTWPDIGAPGVSIWSTAPRDTVLDMAMRNQNPSDLYYIPMSGTSMATPHMAGIGALLYQAAPHLGIATYVHEDHETFEGDWYGQDGEREDTMITEAELILEMTGRYINGAQAGAQGGGYPSVAGSPHDWGQGHGLVDVDHAVALALTLEELRLRDNDGDGVPDMDSTTVFDAYAALHGVDPREDYNGDGEPDMVGGPGAEYNDPVRANELVTAHTDAIGSAWKGEWAHFTDDEGGASTDNTHYLYIPEGVTSAHVSLDYSSINLERNYIANLDVTLDADGDGSKDDLPPAPSVGDHKHYEIDVTPDMRDRIWVFGMNGDAFGGEPLAGLAPEEYWEPLVSFNLGVRLFMEPGSHVIDESNISGLGDFGMDSRHYARLSQLEFAEPSLGYTNGTITLERTTYNLSTVTLAQNSKDKDDDEGAFDSLRNFFEDHPGPGALLLMVIVVLVVVAFMLGKRGSSDEDDDIPDDAYIGKDVEWEDADGQSVLGNKEDSEAEDTIK